MTTWSLFDNLYPLKTFELNFLLEEKPVFSNRLKKLSELPDDIIKKILEYQLFELMYHMCDDCSKLKKENYQYCYYDFDKNIFKISELSETQYLINPKCLDCKIIGLYCLYWGYKKI